MKPSASFLSYLKDRVDIIFPALLCLITGILYTITLLPGTGYWGDTAELQYTGKILGTTHPTGYPLYLMVNHVFVSLFPIGTLAYKANLLSVIFAVLALIVLYQTFRLLGIRAYIAFISSLVFTGTYTFWLDSVIAEVYSLNILFAALVIYFLIRWHLHRSNTDLLIGCMFFGLSLGNHITMILFLPAIIILILLTDHKVLLNIRNILFLILFAILGMAQYLYIVWRTFTPGAHLYVKIYDLPSFYACLSGAESKEQMFAFSFAQFFGERLPWFLGLLWQEFSLFLILAAIGLIVIKNKKLLAFLALIFIGVVTFLVNFSAFDAFTFFIPAYYIIAIFIGIGLFWTYERVSTRLNPKTLIIFSLILLLLPGLMIFSNYDRADQSNNIQDAQNIEALLKIPEKEAYYVGNTHDWSIGQYIGYYTYGEGWITPNITYWYTPENNMERVFDQLYRYDSNLSQDLNPVYTSQPDFYQLYGFVLTPVNKYLSLISVPEERPGSPVILLNRFYEAEGFSWMGRAGMLLVGSADEGDYRLTFDAKAFEKKTGVTIIVNKEPTYQLKISPQEGIATVELHLKKGKNTIVIRSDESDVAEGSGLRDQSQDGKVSIGIRNVAITPV